MNKYLDLTQLPTSINDLKDRYYSGVQLSVGEKRAVQNYDKYRLAYLNSAEGGQEFDKRYLELQAKANLSPFSDFL